MSEPVGARRFLFGDKILNGGIAAVVRHARQQALSLGQKRFAVHRHEISGVRVAAREPLYGAAVQVQPNSLTQMLDAADVIGGITLLVDGRFDFPIPPSAVMLLRGQHHRSIRAKPGKSIVAPVGGEQSRDARVVGL